MLKKLLVAVSLMGLALPSVASAEPFRGRDRNERAAQYQTQRNYVVNGQRYNAQPGPRWEAPRNYRHQNWRRGQRLPSDYRRTEVRDWNRYHFRAPPRGQHYVRVGNDVVLASIATGIITAVIVNAFSN